MIKLAYCPYWFLGKDIVIDLFSVITLTWIAYFAFRWYRMTKNGKHMKLTGAFLLMALAFMFKILTNFTIYNKIIKTSKVGLFSITYETVYQSNILYNIGSFFYMLLMLTGLYMLYQTYGKKKPLSEMILMIYLIIVSTIIGFERFYMFHLTALLFLVLVSYLLLRNYIKQRSVPSMLLAASIIVLGLSQLVFMFTFVTLHCYVVAEIVQLTGYMLLFTTFFLVLRDGKKTKQNRHNR